MSTQITLTLVAALVAGGVGSVAASALRPGPQETSSAARASALDPSNDLASQLRALGDANERLLARLERLEAQASMGGAPIQVRMPAAVDNEPVDLEAAIAAVLAKMGTGSSTAIVTPDFRKQVETVLEMRSEEERLQREQERIQREAQALEDRLAKLQTDLGLDQRQVDGMRKVFLDSDTARNELRDSMRNARDGSAPPDFQTMRTQWETLANNMNTQLQGILTPTQYEQYQQSNPNQGFGGRGGFGGPGGGRGGNAGGGNTGGGNTGGGGGGRNRGGNNGNNGNF